MVTILVLLLLNIVLPTLDTITDINLVYQLYHGVPHDYQGFPDRHYYMATALLIPFLLNYFVCFITFLRKEKNKEFTFIFALLNIYPQFGKNNHEEKSLE